MLQKRQNIRQIRFLKAWKMLPELRQIDVVQNTGVQESNLSAYINGRKKPTNPFLDKFYKAFKIQEDKIEITDEDYDYLNELQTLFVKNIEDERSLDNSAIIINSNQTDQDRLLVLSQLFEVQKFLLKDLDAVSRSMSHVLSSKSDNWQADAEFAENLLQKYSGDGKGKGSKKGAK